MPVMPAVSLADFLIASYCQTMGEGIIGFEFHRRYYADLEKRLVLQDRRPLETPLTLMEFSVLEFFLKHPRQLIARSDVTPLASVNYGYGRLPIDDYVSRVNRKLGLQSGSMFVLTRGVGYTLTTSVRPVYGADRQAAGELFKIAEFNFNFHTIEHMRTSLRQSLKVLAMNPHGLPQARITAAYDYVNLSQAAYGAELPSVVLPKAKELALEAINYPVTEAAGHGVLGLIHLIYDYDWEKAGSEFSTALSIDRDETATLLSYAHFLVASGRFEEAIRAIEHAAHLAPDDLIIDVSEGWIHLLAGDAKEGIRLGTEAVKDHPSFPPAHMMLGWAYERTGQYEQAIDQYQSALKTEYLPIALAALGHAYGKLGKRDSALEMLAALGALHERGAIKYIPAYCCALIYAGLGQAKKCLDELERAYDQRCDWLIHLALDQRWGPVKNNSRFKLLVTRVGLPYRGQPS